MIEWNEHMRKLTKEKREATRLGEGKESVPEVADAIRRLRGQKVVRRRRIVSSSV
jgi:hypothetical protein